MPRFDPYHKWLAIPPDQQPPHHYTLLGIAPFEDDLEVIESAGDRQMAHVRNFQGGQHVKLSQQLLNEISAAKVELLDPAGKSAYDERLRAETKKTKKPARKKKLAVAQSLDSSGPAIDISSAGPQFQVKQPAGKSKKAKAVPIPLIALGGGALAAFGIIVAMFVVGSAETPVATPSEQEQDDVTEDGQIPDIDETDRFVLPKEAVEENPFAVQKGSPKKNPTPNPGTIDLQTGLVGHWKFDEQQGDKALDSAGQNHGKITGATWTEGIRGGALHFTRNGHEVSLGNPDALNFEGAITMTAWVKVDSTMGIQNILAHGHSTNPLAEVYLRIKQEKFETGSWDGFDHFARNPSFVRASDTWGHLAGSYDGQDWRIYYNGELINSKLAARGASLVSADWKIGAHTFPNRSFKGTIDEVRIYNRALTDEEVAELGKR